MFYSQKNATIVQVKLVIKSIITEEFLWIIQTEKKRKN